MHFTLLSHHPPVTTASFCSPSTEQVLILGHLGHTTEQVLILGHSGHTTELVPVAGHHQCSAGGAAGASLFALADLLPFMSSTETT